MGKVKIRGIFATWTVADVAKSPEMVFRLKLETNPTHPFVPLSESSNKLILRMRSQQIFIGIITILAASAIAIALYYTQGNESLRGGGSSIFSVPAFIGAWGFALVIFNVQVSGIIFFLIYGKCFRKFLFYGKCKIFTQTHAQCERALTPTFGIPQEITISLSGSYLHNRPCKWNL